MPLEVANFGRVQLASLLHDLNYEVGVEVGVAAGWYSSVLMAANPQMTLYGIDPWVPYRGYTDYTRTSTFSKLEDAAHRRLDKYPNYKFVKKFSADALEDFKDKSLDFVYIDGNHADPWLSEDIRGWYEKLKPGGMLAGHDYTRTRGSGDRPPRNDTRQAVQRFAKEHNYILFILGSSAIREGEIRDKVRSWMILK